MIQNHLTAIAVRWSGAAVFALWVFASGAPAQPANLTTSITGVYNGTYAVAVAPRVRGQARRTVIGVNNGADAGGQGPVRFKLAITQLDNGRLAGVFTLYRPDGSDTKAYTCDLTGHTFANRTFGLANGKWETPPPSGFEMKAGLNGLFDPAGGNGAGQVSGKIRDGSWPKFEAIRDTEESAKMVPLIADQQDAREPATPVAQPRRRSAAAKPATAPSHPSSSAPVPGSTRRSAINGVYIGTYGTNPDDNVPAKLYVQFIDNGSVDGILNGLFTFDVPPSAGAEPITYTYKLVGRPAGIRSGFHAVTPLGKPAPGTYAFQQLWVEFVRSLVTGTNGKLESKYDLDQLSGWVLDSNGRRSNLFKAIRNQAESGEVESLMAAAQASAASRVASTPPPAQRPSLRPSSAPSADIDSALAAIRTEWVSAPVAPAARPGIQGVFNGTYSRENEPPTKFKLTITQTGDGLVGIATIYLPTESGPKAYTYSLRGAQVPYAPNNFELKAAEWETIPPKDFKNFRAMGFNGEFRFNLNQNTARIVSVPESAPNVAANPGSKNAGSKVRPGSAPAINAVFYVSKFEAAWNEAESADIKGTIAAQEAVGNEDQVAALQAHAEVVKNAQPKELASKYLVRKSQAYWDGYRSDFIREVFDGGFAGDVDNDPAFQSLFIDYVDLFSKNCAAYFPADHKSITITTTLTTTYPGGAVDVKTTSKTVEIDTRFIQKYCEYSGVEPEPGSDQDKEQTAKTIAIVGYIFHAGGPSHGTSFADAKALLHLTAAHGLYGSAGMEKFFATELKATGPSAALRQMGENLLRGATGELSLQEAGARIAGAEAETDQSLPPGRFTHLVDAAHAYYREPGNARLESHFETAFDETLAAKYRGVMTREEEYYYANDYGGRFRGQIMQPRSYCQDPEWPRLHPAVEECIAEVSQ